MAQVLFSIARDGVGVHGHLSDHTADSHRLVHSLLRHLSETAPGVAAAISSGLCAVPLGDRHFHDSADLCDPGHVRKERSIAALIPPVPAGRRREFCFRLSAESRYGHPVFVQESELT